MICCDVTVIVACLCFFPLYRLETENTTKIEASRATSELMEMEVREIELCSLMIHTAVIRQVSNNTCCMLYMYICIQCRSWSSSGEPSHAI